MTTEDSSAASILGIIRERCGVCSDPMPMPLYPEARDYVTGEAFEVRRCSRCGVAWTSPAPNRLDPYYPNRYRRYNWIVIQILKFLYRRRVARWSRRFPKRGKALEFGCGDGFMLDALRARGWVVAGTERTKEMARFAREKFGLDIYIESEQPVPAEEKFDLIVLFQVLEHLADPVAQLRRAASLLNVGGSIVIGVPNFLSWQSCYAQEQWFHLDVPRHLVHFSPASLRQTVRESGLFVASVNYVSFEHDPYGWVQSVLNRHFRNQNRLTKLLMRSEPWSKRDLPIIALAILLTPMAIVLCLLSWIAKRGAIMEAIVQR